MVGDWPLSTLVTIWLVLVVYQPTSITGPYRMYRWHSLAIFKYICTSLSVYPYLLLVNSPTRTASWTVQLVCDDPCDWQCGLGDYPIFFGGMRQIQQVLVQFSALLYFVTTGHTRKHVLVVSKLVNNLPLALLYTPKPNKWCFSDLESQQNHSKSYV